MLHPTSSRTRAWASRRLTGIGISAAVDTWKFFRQPPTDPKWYWYEHLGGMIGSGIAAHTAFGAFGMRQIFPDFLGGPLGLVPWIAPSVLGLGATALLTRHYRRKFAGSALRQQTPVANRIP